MLLGRGALAVDFWCHRSCSLFLSRSRQGAPLREKLVVGQVWLHQLRSMTLQSGAAVVGAGALAEVGVTPADASVQPLPPSAAAELSFSAALTSIDPSLYGAQLEAKVSKVESLFAELNPPAPRVVASPPSHYRMRAEFGVWHEGSEVHLLMYERDAAGRRRQVRMEQFPVACELVNEFMRILRAELPQNEELRKKLFQVTFHATLSGESMVTLVYHRVLKVEDWEPAARKLRDAMAQAAGAAAPPHLIGRARKQCMHLGGTEVTEVLEVGEARLSYLQAEGAFSQPNARVAAAMLLWARQQSAQIRNLWADRGAKAGESESTGAGVGEQAPSEKGSVPEENSLASGASMPSPPTPTRDLLELYCGNGNFTVAVAPFFRTVVATEVSKPGVAAAQRNLELNGARNAHVARMRSEDFTREWHAKRTPKVLRGVVDVGACDFSTLLVDPPRAGLDQDTLTLLKEFDHVLYISCNPETLKQNVAAVSDVFEIAAFALFDQFPWTHHVEAAVHLRKRAPTGPQSKVGNKRKAEDDPKQA